jgi:multidrug efflux pump subunit AcrA (membrane-fusion protein)
MPSFDEVMSHKKRKREDFEVEQAAQAAAQAAQQAAAQAAQQAAAAQPFVSQIGDPPLARFISEMETLRTTVSNLSREVNALNEWKARMLAAYMPSPN